jgi:hypothetical protein
MIKNHKNILYTLIAIIIIFFGYWYFVLSKKDTVSNSTNALVAKTSTQNTTQSSQNTYDREFVASLQAIQYVDLNTSILQSPAYKALSFPERPFQVDYNIPVGRRNPFLPIGVETQTFELPAAQQPATTTITATTTFPTVVSPKKKK